MLYVTCEASDCGVEFLAEIHRSADKVGKSARAQWYSYDCDEQFIEHANEEAAMIHLQHFIHECREDLRRDGQWPEGITDPELVPRWGVMMTVGRAVEVSRDDGPDFDLRRNDGSARGDNPIRIPEAGE